MPSEKAKLAHGLQPQFEIQCPVCSGLRWVKYDVPVEDPEFGKMHPCPECRQGAQIEHLAMLSRLEGDLLGMTFKDWIPREDLGGVLREIHRWMTSDLGWLTLSGPPGTGKTLLLASIANSYIQAGDPCLYTTMADLLSDLRDTFKPGSDQVFSQLFANASGAKILLIDEAEKWSGTDWAQEQVFRLLERRSRDLNMRTALATNTDLRPLRSGTHTTLLHEGTKYPGYLESRIAGGVLLTDFWLVDDMRPAIGKARQEALL